VENCPRTGITNALQTFEPTKPAPSAQLNLTGIQSSPRPIASSSIHEFHRCTNHVELTSPTSGRTVAPPQQQFGTSTGFEYSKTAIAILEMV
jgi:hypothetical protein